jgi:hypothetical protein
MIRMRWTFLAIIFLACGCIAPSPAIACDTPCTPPNIQHIQLFTFISEATLVPKTLIKTIGTRSEAISIGDMFEMQMLMNNLSQLSEMATGVVAGSNSAISSPARNVRGFAYEPKSDIERQTDEVFSALDYADGNKEASNFDKAPDRIWVTWANIGSAFRRCARLDEPELQFDSGDG